MFLHPGNRLFMRLVTDSLREYANFSTKLQKGVIICKIVAQVRHNSPNGGIVKWDAGNGRWYEVGDFLAREKVSQTFRDALFGLYKSSNKAKRLRRLQDQNEMLSRQSSFAKRFGSPSGDASEVVYAVPCPAAVAPRQTCPNLGESTGHQDISIHSMRNAEWDQSLALKARLNIMDALLVISNSLHHRHSSVHSVVDIAAKYQHTKTSHASFEQAMKQGYPAKQPRADTNTSVGYSGLTSHVLHHDLADGILDRLVGLVGDFDEGDPFEPLPVTTDRASEEEILAPLKIYRVQPRLFGHN